MYGYYRKNPFLEFPKDGETYYHLRIEELPPNTIQFKFNNTKFAKEMEEIKAACAVSQAVTRANS